MNIQVNLFKKTAESYGYKVTVDNQHNYLVTLPKSYYQAVTNGAIEPDNLVYKSFLFLLEREPATSIMKEFELPVIQRYFPEYETTISQL